MKTQIILCEENEETVDLLSLNLISFLGCEVISCKNALEAIELLVIFPEVPLILTGGKVTSLELDAYILKSGLKTRLLLIDDVTNWKAIVLQSSKILNIPLKSDPDAIDLEMIPVPLYFLHHIQTAPCDIYLKIKKGSDDAQMVKWVHTRDALNQASVEKFQLQGLKEFFVPKIYTAHFSKKVTSTLSHKLENRDLTQEQKILITANGYEVIKTTIELTGIDEACIELADASINDMVKSLKKTPEMAKLLKFLVTNKLSYAYQHYHLLTLMSHYVLAKQSWFKEEQIHVLTFVSFFADVALQTKEQMQVSNLKELNQSGLSADEKKKVLSHASDAVKTLQGHPEATDYIKTVLLQSHGRLDGIGFEPNPPEELLPLSKVFIIADTFVKILLNPALPIDKKDILSLLSSRFLNSGYQKIISSLEQKFEGPKN